MLKNKQIILIFIPAILIGVLALFVRIVQYQPLFPKIDQATGEEFKVPVFEDDAIIGNKKTGS